MPLIKGALSGTVVADQGGDLAGGDVEVHPSEDVHGAEALVDAAQTEHRSAEDGDPFVLAHGDVDIGGSRIVRSS
jgi:hypothetical protein